MISRPFQKESKYLNLLMCIQLLESNRNDVYNNF